MIFSSLEALPAEASADRAAWEQEGVHAVLLLPLLVEGQVTHLVGMRSVRNGHEWPHDHIPRLRFLGEVFARALIQRHAQEALLKSERRLSETQRIAHVGSWDWDISSGDLQLSDEVYRIFGLPLELHQHPQDGETA